MLVVDNSRKLARFVLIDAIKPMKKADRLEIAVIGGWDCVVQKDLFKAGDKAIYFEIDSAIPLNHILLANFNKAYLKVTEDEYTKEKYAVIKTVRLRGELSQGLLVGSDNYVKSGDPKLITMALLPVDTDLTSILNVMKYVSKDEAKLYSVQETDDRDQSAFRKYWNKLRMKLIGKTIVDGLQPWPLGCKKSEEPRVQNSFKLYNELVANGETVEESIKLNGESATFFVDLLSNKAGVASRNYSLRTEDIIYTKQEAVRIYVAEWMRYIVRRLAGAKMFLPRWKSRYYAQSVPLVAYFHREKMAEKLNMINNSASYELIEGAEFLAGKTISVQGEMVGPDFNGNAENAPRNRFYMYRAYANGGIPFTPEQTRFIAKLMDLDYIPVVSEALTLPPTIAEVLKRAEGPGFFDKSIQREGVVLKSNVTGQSVKVISNKWLEQKKLDEEAAEAAEAALKAA